MTRSLSGNRLLGVKEAGMNEEKKRCMICAKLVTFLKGGICESCEDRIRREAMGEQSGTAEPRTRPFFAVQKLDSLKFRGFISIMSCRDILISVPSEPGEVRSILLGRHLI